MQKLLLWLFFAVVLSFSGSAQTNFLPVKWTTDQKVVLDKLPTVGQDLLLPVPPGSTLKPDELNTTCSKMSNEISEWKMTEDGKSFVISLGRDHYPEWTQKDWEIYINRLSSVYLIKR